MNNPNEPVAKSKAAAAAKRGRSSALRIDSPSGSCEYPREQMIAEAAYFKAEQRGFTPGNEMLDWLEAEAEVEGRLRGYQ